MNLRQVVFLLIAAVGVWSLSTSIEAQQVQIKGPKNSSSQLSGNVYGPIKPSDTLWRIASRYRQNSDLSVYQVMQAIYELNPEAFENSNFNHLVDGSILKLPSERYIARIDQKQARLKAEADDSNWQTDPANIPVAAKAAEITTAVSKEDLTATKQGIEDKLTALDAEQNRQFMAIRQQFAESINSVQSLLDENRKLVDRLDNVDSDISSLRGRVDEELQVQMDQMLALQNELLSISRQAEAQRKAELEQDNLAWLTDPLFLILLSVLLSISLLGALAMWMIRKNRSSISDSDSALSDNHAAVLEQSDEMDDLADALTNELNGDIEEQADDDLFADDDLLDDVLSDELEESLDSKLDDDFENFDDLDDDSLDPIVEETSEENDEDDGLLDQNDLDSLFDEDDDLLAEIEGDSDEALDQQTLEDSSLVDDLVENEDSSNAAPETEQNVADETEIVDIDAILDSTAEPSDQPVAPAPVTSVVDEEPEKPEISIDELLEQPEPELPESIIDNDSELMSEAMLQNIDREITSQNVQLDNITDELLTEIEQLEQMGSMVGDLDDDDSEQDAESDTANLSEPQMGIQELDSISDGLEDMIEEDDSDEMLAELDDILVKSTNTDVVESDEIDSDDALMDSDDVDALLAQQTLTNQGVESLSADELLAEMDMGDDESGQQDQNIAAEVPKSQPESIEVTDSLDNAVDTQADEEQIDIDSILADSAEISFEQDGEEDVDSDKLEEHVEDIIDALDTDVSQDSLAPEDSHDSLAPEDAPEDSHNLDVDAAESDGPEDSHNPDDDIPELEKALEEFDREVELESTSFDVELDDDTEQAISQSDGIELETLLPNSNADDLDKIISDLDDDIPSIGDLDSLSSETTGDIDDSDLEEALKAFDESALDEQSIDDYSADSEDTRESVDLEDLPGLGDWLSSPEAEESASIDELEKTSFDELLDSIDEDVDDEDAQPLVTEQERILDETGLDFDALLNEPDASSQFAKSTESRDESDFLDVDDLINESIEAEGLIGNDQEFNLSAALDSYPQSRAMDEMVDVDSDDGIGAKLDLAQAYIETDDNDSAAELLQEVLEKGDESQKVEAKELLDKLP
ncbi:FimV/HubP family polar landmark protein [Aliiglaciecola sp. LCG003]|uniref:FimV/HubP family polar landmark protein n=1 Tax=Aliiglaciecola sp. LCG003 TaxID=3053655 RepID=UPI0025733ECE|nr:FimV/HubP family polar landmark protein [Aliiglaciecola sp. LCG003]WJG08291.1 FimV/HubP family polar landmark protein [Aliiglaciecola sp. LCG003]